MEGKGRGCNRVEIPTSSFHLILFGLKGGKGFCFFIDTLDSKRGTDPNYGM